MPLNDKEKVILIAAIREQRECMDAADRKPWFYRWVNRHAITREKGVLIGMRHAAKIVGIKNVDAI